MELEHKTKAPGFVYCILHHERNAAKIGYSRNPAARLSQISTSSPDCLTLYGQIPGDRALERAFHKYFSSRRMRGEWFDNSDGLVTAVIDKMAWEAAE